MIYCKRFLTQFNQFDIWWNWMISLGAFDIEVNCICVSVNGFKLVCVCVCVFVWRGDEKFKEKRKKYLVFYYNSVVCSGMSRGISFRPRPLQSTTLPSHWQDEGHSTVSARHSPANFIRASSQEPGKRSKMHIFI